MIFAEAKLEQAVGAVLAHSLKAGATMLKKGRVLSAGDVETLRAAGREAVTVARLEPGDLPEDEAARRIAEAGHGANVTIATPFTGRCNLHAAAAGLIVVDRERLDRLNAVHESITLATLPPFELVAARDMVATVKIVPFAVAGALVGLCVKIACEGGALVRVALLRPRVVALIQTTLPVDYTISDFFGGTGLLIVVGVALDMVNRIESHMLMERYEGFLKGGMRIRGRKG